MRRLNEAPRPPRELVPDLDPAWEAAILRCLQRQPRDRFPRAGDVVKALERRRLPPRPCATRRRAGSPSRPRLLAVLVAAWPSRSGGYRARQPDRRREERTAAAHAPLRRSVAVLGFRNVSGRPDAAWLSTAFSEMLTTELGAGEQLRTIPGENVARMKVDLALADADTYAPDTLERIRDNLGTDLVVFGSYVTVGEPGAGTIRLDARLQDSRAGQTLALVSETSPRSRCPAARLANRRTPARTPRHRRICRPRPSPRCRRRCRRRRTPARLYSEGLERLRRFDALAARERARERGRRRRALPARAFGAGDGVVHARLRRAGADRRQPRVQAVIRLAA